MDDRSVGSDGSGEIRADASARRRRRRRAWKAAAVSAAVLAVVCLWGYWLMIKMPGKSYAGALAPWTAEEAALAKELRRDVEELAGQIGERNVFVYSGYVAAADFIEGALRAAGYEVQRQAFEAWGKTCWNVEAEVRGWRRPEEILVVGAHYDSLQGTVGANDNGSAVAAALALGRRFAGRRTGRTVRFVFFANEEPPFFTTAEMGSWVYAKRCRRNGENIVGMISLETIGYYSDEADSQHYPFPLGLFYPSRGDFVAFASDTGASRGFLREVIGLFREKCRFPSQGGSLPGGLPGIGWSDHWAFWQEGYRAIMVTDTAPFRYPYYHTAADTPEKVDYERLSRVVSGLCEVIVVVTK
jgi:hypothetical protein